MESESIPATQDFEDTGCDGDQAASERSCAESIARFYEENATNIMCWASAVVPVPESERENHKRICAGVIEASLNLAKVAARVVWGLGSSDRYHDDNTDFSKIANELEAAFKLVKNALPVSPCAPGSKVVAGSSAAGSRSPSPALPTSDIYQEVPSDGVSPGQIIEDVEYCIPSAGAHRDLSTPLPDDLHATASDATPHLARAFQVVAQEFSLHLAHSLKETVSECVHKAVDQRLEDRLFEDRLSTALAKRLLPELMVSLQHTSGQSGTVWTKEDGEKGDIKRPRPS